MPDPTVDEVLAKNDHTRIKVPVPEWGVTLWCATMTGEQRDEFDRRRDAKLALRAWLVVVCCQKEDGSNFFRPTDIAAVNKKNGAVLDRLVDAIVGVNYLGKTSIEELEGNSSGGATGAPGSTSPQN